MRVPRICVYYHNDIIEFSARGSGIFTCSLYVDQAIDQIIVFLSGVAVYTSNGHQMLSRMLESECRWIYYMYSVIHEMYQHLEYIRAWDQNIIILGG